MGSKVFLAESTDGNQVALKLLTSTFAVDQRIQKEVFNREVDILRKFGCPAVPKLLEAGFDEKEGTFYLVSEYIRGSSLREILQMRGALSSIETIKIIAELLATLDFYHSHLLVHRDVKPANVIVTDNDELRLVDFGIAKDLTRASEITLVGKNLGTPEYMSPEMASGEETDHRTDLYSTGVILYECLAGTTPFKAKSAMHTLLMVLTATPPALPFREDVPVELEEILKKALAKKKENRYESAEEFIKDLQTAYKIISQGFTRSQPAHLSAEVKEQAKPSSESVSPKRRQKQLIYCLDDQVFILNILKHILSAQGFETHVFNTWDHLHEALQQDLPDLVITDIQMPEVNGVKVCRLLKQAFPNLKVILFSNIYEDDLANLCKEAEANDWISKSWTPDIWLSKVLSII